ncbi:MAG TPA: GAF domain-containing sensor histidine kinase, partial [Candidatus Saccharimonadales bacterium]|nr:GAF domain-containing sensor histidine kinase [Candidatus Saccharimonadales bacterium]
NKVLNVTTDLRGLLERVAHEIGTTLKSEQAFFFINTDDGHYITAGTLHHKQLPKSDADQIGVPYSEEDHGVVIASELKTSDPIRRLMLSHRIELILPLVQDDKVIGYLCLGDHLTSGYTHRDIKALNTIANELVIAIQNALAVQEIRVLNSTLQQRIANATKELRASNAILRHLDKAKDEFVSMASHQLRTPLTSVKGYISMVLEGDAGEISDNQRQFLNEAFMSSERMVHLINDFLNVSRIQTGKFIIDKHPTDLSKVIEQEIDSLQPSAISRNLKFVYHRPKDFPMLDIDEGKIRQVIMNFADNALYYSHDNTSITINLSIDKNEALFTVKDLGIGVPIEEQEQLFRKFYRASNARKQRPDGTGVGLYLAKEVIDAHGGKVVFESIEGKGSTFGFRLPLNN